MNVLVFATQPLWAHHYETDLELTEGHLLAGDTVVHAVCDAVLPTCYLAPSRRNDKCRKCVTVRERGERLLSGRVKQVPILGDEPPPEGLRTEFPDVATLARYSVDGFDVGAAVASSVISELRDPNPSTARHAAAIRGYLTSAVQLYRATLAYLDRNPTDRVYVFNGRFAHPRAVLRACQARGVACWLHERGHDIRHYGLFENALPHEIAHLERLIRERWDAAGARPDRLEVASSFFEERAAGQDQGWFSFTKHHDPSRLPEGWDDAGTRIVVYNSSEDEFAAIGDEWKMTLYRTQLEGLERIVSDLEGRTDVHVFVRMHPNSRSLGAELEKWLSLRSPVLTVIPPESKISTYALLREADLVLTFGSTVGIEAAYFGKPSILAGPAIYAGLGGTYNPATHDELMALLRPGLPARDRTAALQYGFYFKTFGRPYRWFEASSITSGTFKGVDLHARPGRARRLLGRLHWTARKVRWTLSRS